MWRHVKEELRNDLCDGQQQHGNVNLTVGT